jgi:hypothetical protein
MYAISNFQFYFYFFVKNKQGKWFKLFIFIFTSNHVPNHNNFMLKRKRFRGFYIF